MQMNPMCEELRGGYVDYASAEAITLTKNTTVNYTPTKNGYIFYRGLFGEYIITDNWSNITVNGGDPARWSSEIFPASKGRPIGIFTSCDTYNCYFVPIKEQFV